MHSGLENTESHKPLIALVGTPNSGKTTLYNWITGSKHRTVNYPGATIEYSLGESLSSYGDPLSVMDTPGIYSLSPRSPEEKVTLGSLQGEAIGHAPQVIVAVIDSTQLARNLIVFKQLSELGIPTVIALTMTDLLKQQGIPLRLKLLQEKMGVPVVGIDGRTGDGVDNLMKLVTTEISRIKKSGEKELHLTPWSGSKIERELKELIQLQSLVTGDSKKTFTGTQNIDRYLLHPFWGLLFFILVMGLFFTSIFWFASPLMKLVDAGFSLLADSLHSLSPQSLWMDALTSGVIKSMGAVMIFVPQIAILFIGLIFLEDSGYLARAATLMDKPLSKIGLNGKSFIPILSGYACAIPAMMAARTISNPKERKLTLFIIPLLSCSARLPVYALLLAFLFQGRPSWQPGLAFCGIYFLSMILGAAGASLAQRFIKENSRSLFMLELPLYRRPKFRVVFRSAFLRTRSYILKAGPMIFVLSLLIWAGSTFPKYQVENRTERLAQSYAGQMGQMIEPLMKPLGSDWRVGLGLLSAFAAREVFVSSMAIIFSATESENDSSQGGLVAAMRLAQTSGGKPLFTFASIVSLIIYFMIALQCLSTVSVSYRESGSLKFALMQLAVFNIVGYLAGVLAFQLLTSSGFNI